MLIVRLFQPQFVVSRDSDNYHQIFISRLQLQFRKMKAQCIICYIWLRERVSAEKVQPHKKKYSLKKIKYKDYRSKQFPCL